MERLKNAEGKNEQQLVAIRDQGERQLEAIRNQRERQLDTIRSSAITKNHKKYNLTMRKIKKQKK